MRRYEHNGVIGRHVANPGLSHPYVFSGMSDRTLKPAAAAAASTALLEVWRAHRCGCKHIPHDKLLSPPNACCHQHMTSASGSTAPNLIFFHGLQSTIVTVICSTVQQSTLPGDPSRSAAQEAHLRLPAARTQSGSQQPHW
jgi:hypothetical protein